MVTTKNIFSTIKQVVEDTFKRLYVKPFGLYVVSDIDPTTYTVNIKNVNFPMLQYDNVKVAGNGIGNYKGIVNLPAKDDMVLVAFIDKNTPIVIGNMFANLVTSTGKGTDTIPAIGANDLLIMNKSDGSNIRLKDDSIIFNKGTKAIARIGDEISVDVVWTDAAGSGTFKGVITEGNSKLLSD